MSKELKDMVSAVTKGTTHLNAKIISQDIAKRFKVSVTEKDVSDFLSEQFYPEEFKKIEERHKGFNGNYYL